MTIETALRSTLWTLVALGLIMPTVAAGQRGRGKRKGRGKVSRKGPVQVSQPAPEVAGRDMVGREKFKLTRWVGDGARQPAKAVVLAFLDPTDPDVGRDFNQLSKVDREWRDENVRLLYVGLGQTQNDLKDFVTARSIPWVVLPDKKGGIAEAFGATSTPFVVLIDGQGVVRWKSEDLDEDRYDAIRAELAAITGTVAPWGGGKAAARSVFLSSKRKYTFGRPPSDEGASIRWQPLAMRIGMAARAYISMKSADSYEDFQTKLAAEEFELANVSPILAYSLRDKYEPVVHLERRGSATARGIVFAARSANVSSVAELRGKTLALVSELSASGGVYPFSILLRAGLEPETDVRILWTGSHDGVARAVKEGQADAGACYDDCRNAFWMTDTTMKRDTVLIGHTDEIPSELIIIKKGLPKADREELRAAILSTETADVILKHISHGEALITGISPASKNVFKSVGKAVKGVPEAMERARKVAGERRSREAVEKARADGESQYD